MERLGPDAFQGDRLRRPGVWAVAFVADWCPFCRSFVPEFENLRGSGTFEIATADLTEDDDPLWEQFGVEVVPTVVVFRDGAVVFRRDGRLGRGLGASDLSALRGALTKG
ncbi:MAG: thioredoxin domain-containing protein [Thermoplasmata archaeon]